MTKNRLKRRNAPAKNSSASTTKTTRKKTPMRMGMTRSLRLLLRRSRSRRKRRKKRRRRQQLDRKSRKKQLLRRNWRGLCGAVPGELMILVRVRVNQITRRGCRRVGS